MFRAYVEQRFFLIRLRIFLCFLLAAALWLGITRFGLVGAISAVVLVTATDRIVMAIRFGRILRISWKDLALLKDIGKLAAAAAAAGLAAECVRSVSYTHLPRQNVNQVIGEFLIKDRKRGKVHSE